MKDKRGNTTLRQKPNQAFEKEITKKRLSKMLDKLGKKKQVNNSTRLSNHFPSTIKNAQK